MKRLLSIILAMVLTISFAIPSLAEGLNDLEYSKYKIEIEKLIEDGTISGYTDGTFRPQDKITRGEFARIIATTLGLQENKNAAEHFVDVIGKWNQGYIGALYEAKIMVGIGQDVFGEGNSVRREELAAILLRIFGLEETANELALELEFKDKDEIATWAKDSVAFASKIGLISGIENDDGSFSFFPKDFGDRELVAKLVYELKYNREVYEEVIVSMKEAVNKERSKEETKIEEKDNKGTSKEDKPTEEKPADKKPSYEAIISGFQDQFSSLESSINSQISSMMSSAMEEYKAGASLSDLMSRYMDMASSLESSTDAKVSAMLSSLSDELSKYGYDTSVVSDFESQYQAAKDAAKSSISLP